MPIDLNPYGLFWILDPTTMKTPIPPNYETALAKINGTNVKFFDKSNKQLIEFNIIKLLGKGSYGITYGIDTKINGKDAVVKMIKRHDSFTTADVLTEVVAQIIISEETKSVDYSDIGLKGPFAPLVFFFAKDQTHYYILSQRMKIDLNELLSAPDLSINIRASIIQTATILDYLWHNFNFNHRDFKPDNIMLDDNGVRIIDFGFCCMKYEGMDIRPAYEFPRDYLRSCSSISRDLMLYFSFF